MRHLLLSLALAGTLLTSTHALQPGTLYLDKQPLEVATQVTNGTTYVSLRTVTEALHPNAQVVWDAGRAVVNHPTFTLTAQPGQFYLEVNGRYLYIPEGVWLQDGVTLVPVRVLAEALGAEVTWDGSVHIQSSGTPLVHGDQYYDSDTLYWLSRIISAESQGEPLLGKLAVGNVVLNRIADQNFPNSLYGVIFDKKWGVQFEPVANGTIYHTPTEESILAAKLVLDGAMVAPNCLYFLAPHLTSNHWIMENRPYVMTIGCHWFYQ